MNITTNYHLPQWEAHDPVKRDDFNGAMASLDAGLNTARGAAATAQSAANTAQTAANKAQQTANAAQTAANKAQQTADAAQTAAKELPYVVGVYAGNGVSMDDGGQDINLGFLPRFAIITRGWISNTATGPYFLAVGSTRTVNLTSTFTFTTTGFRVGAVDNSACINLNNSGFNYTYIAFP